VLVHPALRPAVAQQPASPQLSTTAPQRDQQALAILNQSLAATGGARKLATIQDFIAAGSITYFWAGDQVQGAATIRAVGTTSFRIDANLPRGARSWAIASGKGALRETNGQNHLNPFSNAIHLPSLTFPQWKILAALSDSSLSIQYSGVTNYRGSPVNIIRVVEPVSTSTDPSGIVSHLSAMEFLIDVSTSRVRRNTDAFHPPFHPMQDVGHEIAFADYRPISGSLVPFSIAEALAGQETWTLQLSSIAFNTGLTSADFQL